MAKVEINRQLMGLEDLLLGTGTVTQIRGGQEVVVTKLSTQTLLANGFTWVAETLPPTDDVEVELSGNTITFRIPKGVAGANGVDGMTPQYEFIYNESTGNLEYNLTGYIPSTQVDEGEW